VDVTVRGRNVEVPDHFRQHVTEKIERVERYDHRIIRVDVELYHEPNPRQSASCQRVEVTCATRGPVVRAEACASDFYRALDAAVAKLDSRMRRSADRRRVHRGSRTPMSVAAATGGLSLNGATPVATLAPSPEHQEQEEFGGLVVREKEHSAGPMTIDRALFEMELVGHDFYLFSDADTGRPSVVYRRKGYDYGVIRLVD
jgi:ribosomal subunit interface protein